MSGIEGTLVGGAVGAAIGFALPVALVGAGGLALGWSIGTLVGGIIDGQPQTPIGKVGDLKYSGSAYGVVIPRGWGSYNVGGNIFWVANYINNRTLVPSNTNGATHLVQHTVSSGGGGGSGGAGKGGQQYKYTASFACSFGEGTWCQEDGTLQSHNPIINRIWANDLLIYSTAVLHYKGTWNNSVVYHVNDEVAYDSGSGRIVYVCIATTVAGEDPVHYIGVKWNQVAKVINKFNIRIYDGSETQAPDPFIANAEAAGDTTKIPAMLGQIYIVVSDMDLTTDFGSSIPSLTAEILTDPVTVGTVLSDIANRSWNYGAAFDSSLATATLTGFTATSLGDAQSFIDAITKLYSLDMMTANTKVSIIPRGGSIVATIPYSMMGASKDSKTSPTALTIKLGARAELPAWINLTYYDVDMDYQQNIQVAFKSTGQSTNPVGIQTDLILHAFEAAQMVSTQMDQTYLNYKPFSFPVSRQFSFITPTDPIYIFDELGNEYRVRVLTAEYGQPGPTMLSAVLDNPNALVQTQTGATSISTPSNPGPASPCVFHAWSGKELRDQDEGYPGFYVATTWDSNGRGGTVYYSTDSGSTWTLSATTITRSIIGVSNTVLANASGGTYPYWDSTNSVQVNLDYDGIATLVSMSSAQVLDSQNICVLGSEILGFMNATLIVDSWPSGPRTFSLSNLYRGVRGSTFTGHAVSEQFVMADSSVIRVVLNSAMVGQPVQVKVLAPGQALTDVTAQTVTIATPTPNTAQQAQTTASTAATNLVTHEALAATSSVLGHVKIGMGISVAGDGTISVGGGFMYMVYLGAWITLTAYVPGDVVTDAGSTYVCKLATSSASVPGSLPANWDVI